MPRIKKNRRHLLDRRKNDESRRRSKTATVDEDVTPPHYNLSSSHGLPTSTNLSQPNEEVLLRNQPNSMLSLLHDQLKEEGVDKWTTIRSDSSLQVFTIQNKATGQPRVDRTVTVNSDLSWCVYVCDRLLKPEESGFFSGLPVHVSNIHSPLSILRQVESAEICAGNPDPDFVSREGGQFRGLGG